MSQYDSRVTPNFVQEKGKGLSKGPDKIYF